MPGPFEKFKLPTGLGSLIRYSANGRWTWQRRDNKSDRWVRIPTSESNVSKAQQFVYQLASTDDSTRHRIPHAVVLFSTVAKQYIHARENGERCKPLRASSLKKVRTAINSFKDFLGDRYASICIDHVTENLLQTYIDDEAVRISLEAANSNLDIIGQILKFAVKKKLIRSNPGSNVVRAFANSIDDEDDTALIGWPCPTPDEVRLILANASPKLTPTGQVADNGSNKGRRVYRGINANDYTDLYTSICLTGMRRAEALFLTWDDLDLNNKILLVQPGKKNGTMWRPKNRSSIRRIAVVPQLAEILHRLRDTNKKNDWVFESRRGTQISLWRPTQRLGEICGELGFETHFVLHSLRKYWASTVAQQGMDWKVMLKMFGHSDFDLILSTYYAQNDDARLVAEASKIDYGLDNGDG